MTSLPAIMMLGKLLEQEEEYLATACTDPDESIDHQITVLNELWLIYVDLYKPFRFTHHDLPATQL